MQNILNHVQTFLPLNLLAFFPLCILIVLCSFLSPLLLFWLHFCTRNLHHVSLLCLLVYLHVLVHLVHIVLMFLLLHHLLRLLHLVLLHLVFLPFLLFLRIFHPMQICLALHVLFFLCCVRIVLFLLSYHCPCLLLFLMIVMMFHSILHLLRI